MRLRIHIENDPEAPPELRMSETRMRSALQAASENVEITVNDWPDRMAACIAGATILFACRKLSIRQAKAASPSLAWTQVITAGAEAFLPELPPGVLLTNSSGVHGAKGAEFILAGALMLNYNIPQFVSDQRNRVWRPVFDGTTVGKTVVLLGVGGIGVPAARMLLAHGMAVIGVTRSGKAGLPLSECVSVAGLNGVIRRADVLVSTLPLTPETTGLIDAGKIGALPSHAGLVIVGRAGVFDMAAVTDRLRAGTLAGAVLDVFPSEPVPPDSDLWTCPRLIVTPHCSLDDHTTYLDQCLTIFCDNLARFRAGVALRNLVDPSLGY